MSPQLTDDQLDALADRVIDRLETGRHGDRWLLSRRQILALGGMGLSATGLMALGVDEATAQSAAGQVGTQSEPVDVEAASVNAQSVSTTRVNVTGLSDGVQETFKNYELGEKWRDDVLKESVSTTPKTIFSLGSSSVRLTVFGVRNDGEGTTRFVDEILVNPGADPVTTKNGRGSAATRSYSTNIQDLELTMGSGTYDVISIGTVVDP